MRASVARDIAVLDHDPDIGWTTPRVLDLMPDGSTLSFDFDHQLDPSSAATYSTTGSHTTTAPRSTPRRSAYGGEWMSREELDGYHLLYVSDAGEPSPP